LLIVVLAIAVRDQLPHRRASSFLDARLATVHDHADLKPPDQPAAT
jgi:hypothetical protein